MKQKTHRGAAKRLRVTGSGKILRRKASGNHMLGKKSSSRKRRISGTAVVRSERATLRKLLGV